MPGPVTPEHGVRIRLTLVEATEAQATYALTCHLPSGDVEGRVSMVRGDAPTIEASVDAWVLKHVNAVARSVAKASEWPRRVTRWKAQPA